MNKSNAFVDTTILTNILIKKGKERSDAKAALAKYETTQLPVYAIKEFKAGPLDAVKYLYNKIIEAKTLGNVIIALTSNWRQPHKRDTALRLLGELQNEAELLMPDENQKKRYGEIANPSRIIFDSVKLKNKMLLIKAWKKRRKVTTEVVQPLSCYKEIDPFEEKNGQFSLKPTNCETNDCCLRQALDDKRFYLTKLRLAIDKLPANLKNKDENQKRLVLLREINTRRGRRISNADCRNLGDVIFVLFCPTDCDILTTNIKDHQPLADTLNKTAVSPEEILKPDEQAE